MKQSNFNISGIFTKCVLIEYSRHIFEGYVLINNSKTTRPVLDVKLALQFTNLALIFMSRMLEVSLQISKVDVCLMW